MGVTIQLTTTLMPEQLNQVDEQRGEMGREEYIRSLIEEDEPP